MISPVKGSILGVQILLALGFVSIQMISPVKGSAAEA
jgi:hypothetical protein